MIEEHIENMGHSDLELMKLDGLDDAVIGISSGISCLSGGMEEHRLIYDERKCLVLIMGSLGLNEEDALEHLYTNVKGSYLGPKTPIFIEVFSEEN